MKKFLLGLTLLASLSSFAAINDGQYKLVNLRCKGQAIPLAKKAEILKNLNSNITILTVNQNEITMSSVDNCGAMRSVYSLKDKAYSTRMNFISSTNAKFPDTCPNTQQMPDTSDMFVENVENSRIEILAPDLKSDEICDEQVILAFEKI